MASNLWFAPVLAVAENGHLFAGLSFFFRYGLFNDIVAVLRVWSFDEDQVTILWRVAIVGFAKLETRLVEFGHVNGNGNHIVSLKSLDEFYTFWTEN